MISKFISLGVWSEKPTMCWEKYDIQKNEKRKDKKEWFLKVWQKETCRDSKNREEKCMC